MVATAMTPDAVVIGAGPNGLVAANLLADAGWDVVVIEAQGTPGGAVRSEQLTVPGFCHDVFSAFYPLAAVSPALTDLHLEEFGLRWRRASTALAHVFADGRCAVIARDADVTAASVERFGDGDGAAWLALVDEWTRISDPLIGSLLLPFPPVTSALKLLARLRRPTRILEFLRTTLLPVRRFASEQFTGAGAAMLVAGNTLHTDLSPDSSLGAFYGWMLAMLAQTVGFPVPEGGAGHLTDSLVTRLERTGGVIRCGLAVDRVVMNGGAASGVMLASGEFVPARRAVIADVIASKLYRDLVGFDLLPPSFVRRLDRFELDHGTFKVDWALSEAIPWLDESAREAGTVHVGDDMDHLARYSTDLAAGRIPADPFVLMGQMSRADPTRSPSGTETAWAYTHVPNTVTFPDSSGWDPTDCDKFADNIEDQIELRAPGFRDVVLDRYVMAPPSLEAANANLEGGAINGGTAQFHQQLIFRPVLGRAGPQTPIDGLYLASASAHPGGGVHGACGANAARAALRRRIRRPDLAG